MHRHWLEHDDPPAAAGPLHRVPAWIKMGVAIAVVILLVASPASWGIYGGVAIALAGAAAIGRVSLRWLGRRLLMAEPFVIGVALLALVQPHGGRIFAAVMARSTLCAGTLVLLAATTSFSDMLGVMKRARVPGLMVTTLMLMHRYLYVLAEEGRRLRTARLSRTFTAARPGKAWRSLAGVVAQLFVRASGRSERIYGAMCSRGWE